MAKVLIIKPSSLGDIIHAAPAVRRIAATGPDVRVTWVANVPYVPFVRGLPGVADVLPFPRSRFSASRFPAFVPEAVRWARQLRGYDLAVDLQGLQRSGLMARLSGARERFGSRDARELAWIHYNRPVEIPAGLLHAVDRLGYLAEAVIRESEVLTEGRLAGEAAEEAASAEQFRLPVSDSARREAAELLTGVERLVAVCPGTRWKSKRWPVSRWARLVHELTRQFPGVRPVLLGAANERFLSREILSQADIPDGAPLDLVGRGDLWTTAAIMQRADCVIALDSAQLHLAAAVGAPTVSLFGPTDPLRFAPRGNEHRVLRREELTCLGCHERECPLERRACLPDLEVEPVIGAVRATCDR